tara:strand:- start:836 stop:1021 length:186 start_codon:yes stop_codon:yes gene_type:complete
MEEVKFKGHVIEVDREKTQKYYKKVKSPEDKCGCENCQYVAKRRNKLYPKEIKDLLKKIRC